MCLRYAFAFVWVGVKFKVKKKYYTPNKNNPAALAIPPSDSRVKPTSWTKLVEHWKREDVEEDAERNKANRGQSEFPHRTGRTAFADIRLEGLEMMKKGEDISRQNVFRRMRLRGHAEEVEAALEQMNKKLSEVPESDLTSELRDEVFTQVIGRDGHGRVRTFGLGPTPTTFSSNSSSSSASSDRIQKLVDAEVKRQLIEAERIRKEQIAAEIAAEVDAEVKRQLIESERTRKEQIAAEIAAEVAAEVNRQLEAHGIFQSSDNLMHGSPRVPSSVGQDN